MAVIRDGLGRYCGGGLYPKEEAALATIRTALLHPHDNKPKRVTREWLISAVADVYNTERGEMWHTLGRLLRELGVVVEDK